MYRKLVLAAAILSLSAVSVVAPSAALAAKTTQCQDPVTKKFVKCPAPAPAKATKAAKPMKAAKPAAPATPMAAQAPMATPARHSHTTSPRSTTGTPNCKPGNKPCGKICINASKTCHK